MSVSGAGARAEVGALWSGTGPRIQKGGGLLFFGGVFWSPPPPPSLLAALRPSPSAGHGTDNTNPDHHRQHQPGRAADQVVPEGDASQREGHVRARGQEH